MTTSATATKSETSASVAEPTRIDGLDWTKGALIVCMIVYHAINYSAYRPWAFRFLGFLPASFIMITGFLVGQVYAAKVGVNASKTYIRLIKRALKLLLVCTLLNVANLIAIEHSFSEGIWEFGARAQELFLTGNGRIGVFEILIPIGYFLLVSPLLLWLNLRQRAFVPVLAVGIFVLCASLETRGIIYKNLNFFSVGIVGMAVGGASMKKIESFAKIPLVVVAIYCLYRVLSYLLDETYPVQTFGAAASILLLYSCAIRVDWRAFTGRQMITFGRYSLIGYIGQIAILKLLVLLLGGKPQTIPGVLFLTCATLLLTFGSILAIHRSRETNRATDFLYKAIFS